MSIKYTSLDYDIPINCYIIDANNLWLQNKDIIFDIKNKLIGHKSNFKNFKNTDDNFISYNNRTKMDEELELYNSIKPSINHINIFDEGIKLSYFNKNIDKKSLLYKLKNLKEGKVLDVSSIKEIKTINIPNKKSKKIGDPNGIRIVSSSLMNYIKAIRMLPGGEFVYDITYITNKF